MADYVMRMEIYYYKTEQFLMFTLRPSLKYFFVNDSTNSPEH